ncbi:MAG: GIY-YIG nuclease family protein [Imperialibacter sp.]|uniref:GIY-YIG nuclease family protein n=1 Tax=Imperialibacter sp. TaxID=2038411 RepID=UPI0030D6FB23|tara:strand:- start:56 stop:355 length:300 start_codon:yes stop_codon:yes gene_type:complete
MGKGGVIYILTNKNRTTLYVGLTSDLITRLHDHQTKKYTNSFTARYNLDRLVYYEIFHSIAEAVAREKQLKAGKRQTKIDLIEGFNPEWKDLTEEVLKW